MYVIILIILSQLRKGLVFSYNPPILSESLKILQFHALTILGVSNEESAIKFQQYGGATSLVTGWNGT